MSTDQTETRGKRAKRSRTSAEHVLRLSRRELLVVAAAAAVAGCAPGGIQALSPTPTPTPFKLTRAATLYVHGTVPSSVGAGAVRRLAGQAGLSTVTAVTKLTPAPDLVLTYGELPKGYTGVAVGHSPAAVVTNLRVPVDNIHAAQLTALLTGKTTDWQSVGAPYSVPVHLYALNGLSLAQGVQVSSGAKQVTKASDLLSQMSKQAGSLALVPLELPDWTVRNLGVENIYPVQGRGDATKSVAGQLTLQVGASAALIAQGLNVKTLGTVLAGLLVAATPVLDMVAVGDMMLGRGVNNQMVAHHDYSLPYRQIHDEMKTADLRVGNLECTVTDLFPIPTDPSTFTFVSKKQAVTGLTYAGFNLLTVANNHANGPGQTPFMDMIKTLRANNIAVCGGGNNSSEARKAAMVSAKDQRIAMMGYALVPPQGPFANGNSWGIAPVNLQTLPSDIKAARAHADIVIPYFHWGIEYTKDPNSDQQSARAPPSTLAPTWCWASIHTGCRVSKSIRATDIYSLGNFVFDQDWSRPTLEGMLLHLYWRGNDAGGCALAGHAGYQPLRAAPHEPGRGQRFLQPYVARYRSTGARPLRAVATIV